MEESEKGRQGTAGEKRENEERKREGWVKIGSLSKILNTSLSAPRFRPDLDPHVVNPGSAPHAVNYGGGEVKVRADTAKFTDVIAARLSKCSDLIR